MAYNDVGKISRNLMYQEVARRIRDLIEDEELWGRYLAPERELAELFGVSRDTVRKGMEELQQEGLVVRRQGLGTRVIPRGAAGPGQARGQILVGCSAGHGAEFISGIAEVAGGRQWLACFCNLVTPAGRADFAVKLSDGGYDGVVLLSDTHRRSVEELLAAWKGPLVLVDHHFPELPVTSVMEDCTGGVRRAVGHLLELGHRRIGYVGHSRRELNPWKEDGYLEAMRAAGLAHDRLLARAALTFEAGQQAAEELFAQPSPPTAIVASSDRQAWGVWRAAELAGRQVGKDFALVGYGDTSAAAGLGHELSSVAFDQVELGRRAMLGLHALRTNAARPGELLLVPTSLVVRESSKNARPVTVKQEGKT